MRISERSYLNYTGISVGLSTFCSQNAVLISCVCGNYVEGDSRLVPSFPPEGKVMIYTQYCIFRFDIISRGQGDLIFNQKLPESYQWAFIFGLTS